MTFSPSLVGSSNRLADDIRATMTNFTFGPGGTHADIHTPPECQSAGKYP